VVWISFLIHSLAISNVYGFVAGQSWSLANFNSVSNPYLALGGKADSKKTEGYRSIVDDPLNPGRKVLAVRHEAGSFRSNSKGGTTVSTSESDSSDPDVCVSCRN
jgi:hypothetical protein